MPMLPLEQQRARCLYDTATSHHKWKNRRCTHLPLALPRGFLWTNNLCPARLWELPRSQDNSSFLSYFLLPAVNTGKSLKDRDTNTEKKRKVPTYWARRPRVAGRHPDVIRYPSNWRRSLFSAMYHWLLLLFTPDAPVPIETSQYFWIIQSDIYTVANNGGEHRWVWPPPLQYATRVADGSRSDKCETQKRTSKVNPKGVGAITSRISQKLVPLRAMTLVLEPREI